MSDNSKKGLFLVREEILPEAIKKTIKVKEMLKHGDVRTINEAVELAKGYDEPETVAFINGVLGGFMRGEFGESAEAEKKE